MGKALLGDGSGTHRLTVSDTRSLADDSSGDALQQALLAAGHQLQQRQLVPEIVMRFGGVERLDC